jgi:hypothetical protein
MRAILRPRCLWAKHYCRIGFPLLISHGNFSDPPPTKVKLSLSCLWKVDGPQQVAVWLACIGASLGMYFDVFKDKHMLAFEVLGRGSS